MKKLKQACHPRLDRGSRKQKNLTLWIPAFAGMTMYLLLFGYILMPTNGFADVEQNKTTLRLQIPIPGGGNDVTICERANADAPYRCDGISRYIVAIYKWIMGFASILAMLAFVYAGVLWMNARGDSGQVGEAKKVMTNAIVGLVLTLGSYTLLWAINPRLVQTDSLQLLGVKKLSIEFTPPPTPEELDDGGDTEGKTSLEKVKQLGIHCPESGGVGGFEKIIEAFQGKVAYRMGGGHGEGPPFKESNPDYMKYNGYCPAGNVCLDCSGFINTVYACAGLSSPGESTASIFPGTESVTSYNLSSHSINGVTLKAGDLIGYTESQSSNGVGHVIMYAGNGVFVDSHGGDKGRQPGGAIGYYRMTDKLMKKIRHIKR
ncbi:C40 family peptidase [Candidatus Uhrbacteria bacterium]|nr:C40 family peptidase [Candidatus Uhrbacteria bacterium]